MQRGDLWHPRFDLRGLGVAAALVDSLLCVIHCLVFIASDDFTRFWLA